MAENYEPAHARHYRRVDGVASYELPPQTWKLLRNADGSRNAIVCCHKCGQPAALDHWISEDGTVAPSLGCPHAGCDGHTWARLDGWSKED